MIDPRNHLGRLKVIKILIVDEVPLTSEMLQIVLKSEADMEAVGAATSVEGALQLAGDCNILLVNAGMSAVGALKITRALTHQESPVKVLITGIREADPAILEFMGAGAAGYICVDSSVDEMLGKIRAAYNDQALVSPEVIALLISRLARLSQRLPERCEELDSSAALTPRERNILQLMGKGFSNRQIADSLVIELGTVKNHVHNILKKLNVDSRRHAAVYLTA